MNENLLTTAEIEALLGQFASSADVASASRPSVAIHQTDDDGASRNSSADHDCQSSSGSRTPTNQSVAERQRRNRLWAIHEQAARDAGVALSAMLRAAIDVRLTSVEPVACQSVAAGLEMPSCIFLLRSPAIPGEWVLELQQAVLLPMLDRMLGGSLDSVRPTRNRPLTEIEERLAIRLGNCLANAFSWAWESTFSLTCQVDRMESDGPSLSIGPPESEALLARFDVRLGKSRGALHLAIPPQAMDVFDRLLVFDAPRVISEQDFRTTDFLESSKDQAELSVELSPSPIIAEDLANLSVGDLIATEHRVDSPVIVNLDDQPIFLGRLGATAGRKAVRLETESTAPRH